MYHRCDDVSCTDLNDYQMQSMRRVARSARGMLKNDGARGRFMENTEREMKEEGDRRCQTNPWCQNQKTSMWIGCRPAKITRNGKPNTWTASETLVRKSDITGEQAKIQDVVLQEKEEEESLIESCANDARYRLRTICRRERAPSSVRRCLTTSGKRERNQMKDRYRGTILDRFLTRIIQHEKACEHSPNESSGNGNGLSLEAVEAEMAAWYS